MNRNLLTAFVMLISFAAAAFAAPSISGLPDKTVQGNSGTNGQLIDLNSYTTNANPSGQTVYSLTQGNPSLINCFIENNRYLSCGAPAQNQSGSSTIAIAAADNNGSSSDSLVLTVTQVQNNPPTLSSIPRIEIPENSGPQRQLRNLHLYAFDAEDSDSQLDFSITEQSNTILISCYIEGSRHISCNAPADGRTGTSTITVEVKDTDNSTATLDVVVEVFSEGAGGSDAPTLSGIPDVEIMENDGGSGRLLDLFNYARDGQDDDEELDFRIASQSNTSLVFCRIVSDRYFECEAPRENSTGESTITIEVEDTDNETDRENFRVSINNTGSSNNDGDTICGGITFDAPDMAVNENSKTTRAITIRNGNSRSFGIDTLRADEDSGAFTIGIVKRRSTIPANGELETELTVNANSVSSTTTDSVALKASGRFSNGDYCSSSSTEQHFEITVKDSKDATPLPTPGPAPQPTPAPQPVIQMKLVQAPADINGGGIIAIENTGDDLSGVSITVLNGPEGVRFGSVAKQLWQTGERVQIRVDTGTYEGGVSATIRVNSNEGFRNIPVSFNASKPQGTGATGLANLASTAGLAIGLLIIIVLAIVGVVSLLPKSEK